jgi:dihydroflavonol-4-reductase
MRPCPNDFLTALIVGGTGRLGRILASHFSRSGWFIRVLTRNSSEARRLYRNQSTVSFIEADLSEPPTLIDVAQGCHLVLFAAGARRPICATDCEAQCDFQHINVESLHAIGQATLRAGNPPLIHLGSLFVMGFDQDGIIVESTEPCPTTPFGRSERNGELAILDLHRRLGLDCRILRLPPVTGVSPPGGLLGAVVAAAMDKAWASHITNFATTRKPLLAPGDLVSAVEAVRQRGVAGRIYHISSGDFPLRDVASGLSALALAHPHRREYALSHSDQPKELADFLRAYLRWNVRVATNRAEAELAWKPARAGIRDVLRGNRSSNALGPSTQGFRESSQREATE